MAAGSHPGRFGVFFFFFFFFFFSGSTLPKPHYVTYAVEAPGLTDYNDEGVSSIKAAARDLRRAGGAAQARSRRRSRPASTCRPRLPARWFWLSDRELSSHPRTTGRWTAPSRVRFASARVLFAMPTCGSRTIASIPQRAVQRRDYRRASSIRTRTDPNLKKLVATVSFSHPVDPPPLRVARVAAWWRRTPRTWAHAGQPQLHGRSTTSSSCRLRAFGGARDAARRHADDVARGQGRARGARRQRHTAIVCEAVVTIPGRASLRFSEARMIVVDNARYEPEQILLRQQLVAGGRARVRRARSCVRLLPVRHPQQPAEDNAAVPLA